MEQGFLNNKKTIIHEESEVELPVGTELKFISNVESPSESMIIVETVFTDPRYRFEMDFVEYTISTAEYKKKLDDAFEEIRNLPEPTIDKKDSE